MFSALLTLGIKALAIICALLIIGSPLIGLFCIIAEVVFGRME